MLRAKNLVIEEIECSIPDAVYENIAALRETASDREGLILEGTTQEKAARLWQLLHEKSLL